MQDASEVSSGYSEPSGEDFDSAPYCINVADLRSWETRNMLHRLFGDFLKSHGASVDELLSDSTLQKKFRDCRENYQILRRLASLQGEKQYKREHPWWYAFQTTWPTSVLATQDVIAEMRDKRLKELISVIDQLHEYTEFRADENFDSETFIAEKLDKMRKLTSEMQEFVSVRGQRSAIECRDEEREAVRKQLETHLALAPNVEISNERRQDIREEIHKIVSIWSFIKEAVPLLKD